MRSGNLVSPVICDIIAKRNMMNDGYDSSARPNIDDGCNIQFAYPFATIDSDIKQKRAESLSQSPTNLQLIGILIIMLNIASNAIEIIFSGLSRQNSFCIVLFDFDLSALMSLFNSFVFILVLI